MTSLERGSLPRRRTDLLLLPALVEPPTGFKLGELVFEISKAVYETLASSDLSVLKWTFDRGIRATLREIMKEGGNESQWYVGSSISNPTGEDIDNWPNEYKQLHQFRLDKGLERLSGEIKKVEGDTVIEMLILRDGPFNSTNYCAEMLEVVVPKTNLKGGREYL